METSLDLSRELIGKEEATFFVRVAGNFTTDVGIHDEDILVVDRSVEPENGSIVVAALDGELTVKRYEMRSGYPYLMPEAEEYDPIPIQDGQELVVWGVVQHVIHEVMYSLSRASKAICSTISRKKCGMCTSTAASPSARSCHASCSVMLIPVSIVFG